MYEDSHKQKPNQPSQYTPPLRQRDEHDTSHPSTVARTTSNDAKKGEFRIKLNTLNQQGVVTRYSYYDCINPNDTTMYYSAVTCHLSSGQKIKGDSGGYVARKKCAQELAAKAAVTKLTEIDTSPLSFHTQKSAPAQTHVSSGKLSSVTSSPLQSSLCCKQDLNNYIQHQKKMELPEYDTTAADTDKGFICTVRHALLGKNGITGSYYKTKKEAENCAAGKALKFLASDKDN